MKPRTWFLTDAHARGECASCAAPAAGFDAWGKPYCCSECARGLKCECAFRAAQRRVQEIPLVHRARKTA